MNELLLAMLALGATEHVPESRIRTAAEVIWSESSNLKEDPYLVAALSWAESRWKPTVRSRSGDCGIMQVNKRWSQFTCDELMDIQTCVKEGITKLQAWKRRFGKRESKRFAWVCHYNGGNRCGKRAKYYARSVYRYYRRLKSERSANSNN